MTEYAKLVLAVDSTSADKGADSLDRLKDKGAAVEKQTDAMSASFKAAGAALVAAFSVSQITSAADAYTNLTNRLKLVTNSTWELSQATESVFQIAQRSRSELGATGDLYFKIAQNADKLGLTQKEVAGVTETVAQTLALSGATAASSAGAILQFSQALASGAIRGDEFNSVAESAPALMDALSRALGVTRGELRSLAADGRLTADVLIKALQEQADEVGAAFAKTDATVSQSFTRLANATTIFIGQASEATGATELMTDAIDSVTNAISGEESALRDTATVLGVAAAGYAAATIALNAKAVAATAAAAAQRLLNAAVSANPYVIAATALAGLAAAFVVFKRDTDTAIESASDFNTRLAQITGNTEKLRDAQNDMKLTAIMDEIRAKTQQISQIQQDAANANSKLGLAETQRIQELQRQLALLGQAYQEVQRQRTQASAPQEAKSAAQLLQETTGTAKTKKAGATKMPADNFDYGAAGLSFNSLDAMAAEEEASAAAYTAARMERLTTQFTSERDLETARFNQQLEDYRFYAEQKGIAEAESNAYIEGLQIQHGQNMAQIASVNSNTVLTTTLSGLQGIAGAFASHSKTMFKVQKVASIAQGLLSIKTGIANAMALPFPANLAAAATVATQGASIMASIRSLSDSGGGGGISAPSGNVSMPTPGASGGYGIINQAPANVPNIDIRLTGIRPDDMISGSYLQKIIEGIGETLADNGGKMGRVELVTA